MLQLRSMLIKGSFCGANVFSGLYCCTQALSKNRYGFSLLQLIIYLELGFNETLQMELITTFHDIVVTSPNCY